MYKDVLMYCSYHASSVARVQCANCRRPLCPACDHRIKGYPYCQDCIVRGVEGLSAYRHRQSRSRGRAMLAALMALIPGMGAVYNRQNIKALIHFLAIVGLFQLTKLRIVPGLFGFAGFACYVYSIIDAHRTAQLIAQGETPAADEERFKRALIRRAPALGLIMIISGVLLVIKIMQPAALLALAKLFPVALILLGGYLLTRYFKRSRDEVEVDRPSTRPYSLVPGGDQPTDRVRRLLRPDRR